MEKRNRIVQIYWKMYELTIPTVRFALKLETSRQASMSQGDLLHVDGAMIAEGQSHCYLLNNLLQSLLIHNTFLPPYSIPTLSLFENY
jgi:hypothetical protein